MMDKRIIDVRSITTNGPEIHFVATDADKKEIAKRFDLVELKKLEVKGHFMQDDLIEFMGEMSSSAVRTCVSTLKPFEEKKNVSFRLAFSENEKDVDNPDEDILPITKGKIDLFDVFSEEFGLSLDPFPKSVDTYLDYHDPQDVPAENPFAILKKRG